MSLRYGPMSESKKKKKKKKMGVGGGQEEWDEDFIFKSRSLRGMFVLVLYGHAWRNTSVKLVKLTRVIGKTNLWNFVCKQEHSLTRLLG